MKKRILALSLTVLVLVSVLPMSALAADGVTLTVGSTSAESGTDFVLPVTISNNTGITNFNITVTGITDGLTLTKVSAYPTAEDEANEENGGICASGTLVNNANAITWVKSSASTANKALFYLYFTASSAGTYSIGLEQTENTANFVGNGGSAVTTSVVAGTVTVTTPVSNDPYTATLSSTAATVTNGETVSVTVTVGGTATDYNAAEMTLSYPTDILDYTNVSTTSDELSVDSTTDGKLYIVDKGTANASGMTYTFNFTATKAGTGNVTLDSASFGTRLESQTGNLTAAAVAGSPLAVTVNAKTFSVTFPADSNVTGGYLFATEQTPTEGTNFVFAAANDNYTYTDVVVKVGTSAETATEISGVTGDQTNGWNVPGTSITGNLYVTATATPKSYGVTYSYEDANGTTQNGSTINATYGTDYTYTMPDGVAASGATDGFHYEVETVEIDGVATDKYTQNVTDKTVTITGTAITGAVEITLKKVTDSADSWAVAVEADSNIATSEYSVASSVEKGDTIALTIIPATGYSYNVTAKTTEDGTEVALTKNGNVYTTTNGVTENITFVITRSVDTTTFAVATYLEGGMGESKDQNMYLVMIGTNLTDKHYTCNGNAMFWSEEYSANCYLVISATEPTADSMTFTIVDGAATAVSYDMDVNESANDTVDANDAQLAYDMYNKEYNVTTDNVTIWKFLKADVNGDKKLDTNDAAAIVNAVITRMKGN